MPLHYYHGEDDFILNLEVKKLRQQIISPDWQDFNFIELDGDDTISALAEVMTPPFGDGGRLVWIKDTTLGQQCSESLLAELKRIIPAIPENNYLLLTSSKKPDGRHKASKYLQSVAKCREFPLISSWQTQEIADQIERLAKAQGLTLERKVIQFLTESLGNDTRAIYSTLEKINLYQLTGNKITVQGIEPLVNNCAQNSLQLASAIRDGKTSQALDLVHDLLAKNEPALKIVATLVGQFRTWMYVKLQMEAGERDDNKIASLAELNNPKRLYFLKKELQGVTGKELIDAMPILLDLEYWLKRGEDALELMTEKVMRLCDVFSVR